MAKHEDFKDLAKQHLKTAEILMTAGDWPGAAYMLGYVLEFILKAASCKTLKLVSYPESHDNEKVYAFFKTHNFDQLIMISGVLDLFDTRGSADAQQNWSDFTSLFVGEWPTLRYDKTLRNQFDEEKVKKIYNNLTSQTDGIIKVVEDNQRW